MKTYFIKGSPSPIRRGRPARVARFLRRWLVAASVSLLSQAHADPLIDSWLTTYAGQYARIYTTDTNKAAGASVTTWSNGTQTQSAPAYAGVQEIYSSASWVYIRSTGLGSHIMGPWYLNAAHTNAFPNYPVNTKSLYRIPRASTVPGSKTLTGLGSIGFFVDGVAMFDSRDGFIWTGTTESGNGTGYWNREAYVNEGVTFDAGYAHQENTGTHHYHADPIALRYQLGDHVDFNATTKTYSESTNPVTKHSPILGWVRDGYPVYGPYGYVNVTNPASGLARMRSGYVLRDGQNGTQDLAATGRTNIPAWAVRAYGVPAAQSGPPVTNSYPLGRYMEDNDFLGDLGYTVGIDFDLDEYNGRVCVTPEFPAGTYAYFVSISSNGTPTYPYNIGRTFYGNPTGSSQTNITESVTTNFLGVAGLGERLDPLSRSGDNVVLKWSALEGGTYRVEAATDLANPGWASINTNTVSGSATGTATETNGGTYSARYYRVARTALAAYDPVAGTTIGGAGSVGILSVSPTSGSIGTPFTLTINLDPGTPMLPPANAPVLSVSVGTTAGTNNVHVSQTQVTSSLTLLPGAATGAQTVTVVFPRPNNTTVTYTLVNGFTVNSARP